MAAGDRPAGRRGATTATRRRRRVLPDQLPVPGVRGRVPPGRAAVQGGRRGALLRAPGGPRRAGLPAGAVQPGGHGEPAPDPQRAQARHRRPGRGAASRRFAERERISFAAALRIAAERPSGSPGWSPARSAASPAFVRILDELGELVGSGEDGRRAARGGATSAPATPPSWRPARTRRTPPGWRTWPSWSRWPASSPATPRWPTLRSPRSSTPISRASRRRARARARSRRSWSGSRWSPTPTRSPTTTPAWSP